ncbi:hypothetical protein [Glycocaulis sp.]
MTQTSLYEAALELADNPDRHFLALGRILTALREEDPAAFQAWLKEARLSRRKAYYLIRIAGRFAAYPDPDRLARIGWTKLLLLCSVDDEGTLEGLLHLAETETVRNLSRTLRGLEDQGRTRCVLLYFTKAQYARVEKALVAFGAGKAGRALLEKEKALLRLIDAVK